MSHEGCFINPQVDLIGSRERERREKEERKRREKEERERGERERGVRERGGEREKMTTVSTVTVIK